MDLRLQGKVAAIIGGSEGIGRVTTCQFCEERSRVALCARREDILQKTAREIESATGREVLAIRAAVPAVTNESAADNLLVNTVCLGRLKGARWTQRWQAQFSHLTLDEFYIRQSESIPLKRLGEAEDAVDLICFLASERARYITGTAINIAGEISDAV
jgi:NAD(P)-dependent dehydrogenase (short-subunit alcohol dehydrogenase family)